jgi:hypothetical protein
MIEQPNPTSDRISSPSNKLLTSLFPDWVASSTPDKPNHKKFSILQLNCHVSKLVTLSILNSALSYDILILQEPWVNPLNYSPPQHNVWQPFAAFKHSPSSWHQHHKAIIYTQTSIPSSDITLLDGGSQLIVGVELKLPSGKSLHIINLYNPPSFPAVMQLEIWVNLHYSRQIANLLCMDSNLHHRHWNPPGCQKRDPEAVNMLSSLSHNGFCLTSPKHIPTFYSAKGRGSTIDLIWSNFLGSQLLETVEVTNDNFGSDHKGLVVQLAASKPALAYWWTLPHWNNICQEKTQSRLAESWQKLAGDYLTIEEKVATLTSSVKSLQDSLGHQFRKEDSKAKPWWCKATLDPVLKMRSKAQRWMILAKSPDAIDCYKQWNDYFLALVDLLK